MEYKDYFSFTKQERRGIIVFMVSIAIMFTLFKLWPKKLAISPKMLTDYYISSDSLQAYENGVNGQSEMELWDESKSEKIDIGKEKFPFDPNNISLDSLMSLGFSRYGAKNLINYRSKGGVIYNSEKFKSIYGIDTQRVNELHLFISYPGKKVNPEFKTEIKPIVTKVPDEVSLPIIELNSADSSQLVKIKGIGPYTTSKILNFRKRTGGFLFKEQLIELKIINDSLYQIIASQLKVNAELIKKININTADYKAFTTHPYFSSETANAILKYRKQHGSFTDSKHISRIRSIKEETGIKLIPYLSID